MPTTGTDAPTTAPPPPREPDLVRFLRVYAPGLLSSELVDQSRSEDGLFLSVIVRTQGRRSDLLREALLCLCGQDCDDFEVLVVVHGDASVEWESVLSDVRMAQAVLPGRVRVVPAVGGTRTRPVVVGLEHSMGRYAAVLDDDDHVSANWVSAYLALSKVGPGRVLRVGAATRRTTIVSAGGHDVRISAARTEPTYCDPWSFEQHLVHNRTPFHAFAFPLFAVGTLGIELDESLDVVEDWDFLLRAAGALGVADDPREITAIYNVGGSDSSERVVETASWREAEERIRTRHGQAPRLWVPELGPEASIAVPAAPPLPPCRRREQGG